MRKNKKIKIKLKKPSRMLAAIFLVIILIITGIAVAKNISADPTIKELKNLEGKNFEKIINSKIVASVPDGEILAEDVITFSVFYNYQLIGGTNKQYTQEDGLKIKISDTALAAPVNGNSIQISNGAQDGAPLTITVKYKNMSQTFNYTIKVPQAQNK